MGNVHSSSSSSDVLPVEYYLNDLACGEPIESLGSTRFMKVARGRNSEGTCVWKVFLTQEDSSVYEPYRKELFRIRDALVNAPNCCTVKRIYDNPSSFTFFFDTSRHQHCYLAPERFLSSVEYELIHKEKGDEWLFGSLQPSMDLFAVGCVVYELLHDSGKPPFSYGELCHYQRMSSSDAASFLERLLQDIASQFRPLLKLLLNRDPSLRVSAQQVLDGSVLHFPKVLDAFFSYLNAFRPKEITTSQSLEGFEQSQMTFHLEPDDVIAKLKRDEKSIWERLTECEENKPYAILFISLITANIRVLRSDAMNLLVKLASLCGPVVSTERVLPYLVCCLSEVDAQVRASAVYSITELLRPIEPATFEDSLVFIDYLLPELSSMLGDKRHPCPTHVLLAVAKNLGDIAETAYRFHEVGRNLRNGVADDEISGAENISEAQQAADEKTALQKALSDLFEMLCSSQDNSVRHCAVNRDSLAKLYTFFSRMNCGEILLRHMITFLNVKSDWRLRAVFFESLPICVQKNSFDVKPLLQQGLHDFEELVVIYAIHCIIVLVEAKVLGRNEVLELLEDTLPFLSHPNDMDRVKSWSCDCLDLLVAGPMYTVACYMGSAAYTGLFLCTASYNKVIAPADMNSEWNEMFGDTEQISDEKSLEERNAAHLLMQTRSMRTSVCGAQLAELLQHKNELFYKKFGAGGGQRRLAVQPDRTRIRWVKAGFLMGHVLLWNSRNVVGDGPAPSVRSDASFLYNKNYPVSSIGWASNEIIAAAIGDGHVLWVDCAASEPRILTKVTSHCRLISWMKLRW
ncbi:HEAT repeat protein [Ostertagia ostertagi]